MADPDRELQAARLRVSTVSVTDARAAGARRPCGRAPGGVELAQAPNRSGSRPPTTARARPSALPARRSASAFSSAPPTSPPYLLYSADRHYLVGEARGAGPGRDTELRPRPPPSASGRPGASRSATRVLAFDQFRRARRAVLRPHGGDRHRAAVHGPPHAVHVHRSRPSGEGGRHGSPGTHGPCHRADAAALLARRQRRKASCSRGGVAPRPARFQASPTGVSGDFGGDHPPGACRSAQWPPRREAQAASTTGAGHGGRYPTCRCHRQRNTAGRRPPSRDEVALCCASRARQVTRPKGAGHGGRTRDFQLGNGERRRVATAVFASTRAMT